MKKLLLLSIVLFNATIALSQTLPLTISFRGNTPVNSKDTIAYTYPGKIGGYSWLYNAEYIRANFAPITGGGYVPNVRQFNYLSRHYDTTVTVSTTITAAVAAISDASPTKRYKVFVPAGTYNNEAVITKDYVDIIGKSRDSVFVNSSSTTDDTFFFSGSETMISGMTITHTLNIGDTHRYPIHIDNSGSGIAHTMVVYDVRAQTLGTYIPPGGDLIYGAIGIGLHQGQRLDLVNVTGTSATMPGILAHNVNAQSYATTLNLINTTGVSTAYDGFIYSNIGSGQTDKINIIGGSYTGGRNGIYLNNQSGGASEARITIDPATTASSINVLAGSRIYGNANLYQPLNQNEQYQNLLFNGDSRWNIGSTAFNRPNHVYIGGNYYSPGTYYNNGNGFQWNSSAGVYRAGLLTDNSTGDLVWQIGPGTTTERMRLLNADGTLLVGFSTKPFSGLKMAVAGDFSADQVNGKSYVFRDNSYTTLSQIYIDGSNNIHWGWGTGVSDRLIGLANGTVLLGGITTDPGGVGVNKFAVSGNTNLGGNLVNTGNVTINTIPSGSTANPILTTNGGLVSSIPGNSYESPLTFSTGLNRSTNTITNTGVLSITGTSNQVVASGSTGAITLSLPQSIATSSSPSFNALTASNTANNSAFLTWNTGLFKNYTTAVAGIPIGTNLGTLGSNNLALMASNNLGTAGFGVYIQAWSSAAVTGFRYLNATTPIAEIQPAGGPTTVGGNITISGLSNIAKVYSGTASTDSVMVHGSDGKIKVIAPLTTLVGAYSEGTWTPTSSGGITFTTANGRYTKIGNLVTAYFDIAVSGSGGSGSNFGIASLPFSTSNNSGGPATIGYQTIQASAPTGYVGSNSTIIRLYNQSTVLTDTNVVGATIQGSVTYSTTN